MNNAERIYTVYFEPIFDGRNMDKPPYIHFVNIELFASSIEDAIKKGWQSVTITPDSYKLVLVEEGTGNSRW